MSSTGGIGGAPNVPDPGDAAEEQLPPNLFERITGFFRRGSDTEEHSLGEDDGADDTSDDIPVEETGGGTLTDGTDAEPEPEPEPEPPPDGWLQGPDQPQDDQPDLPGPRFGIEAEPDDLPEKGGGVDFGDDDESDMPSIDEVMEAARDPIGSFPDGTSEESGLGHMASVPRPEPEPEPEPESIEHDIPDLPGPRFVDGGDPTFDRPDLPDPLFTDDPVPTKGDFPDPLPDYGDEDDEEAEMPSIGDVLEEAGGVPVDGLGESLPGGPLPTLPLEPAEPDPEPEPEPVAIEDDDPDLPDPLFTGRDAAAFQVDEGDIDVGAPTVGADPGPQFAERSLGEPADQLGRQFDLAEPTGPDLNPAAEGLAPDADLSSDLGYQPTLEPVDEDEGLEIYDPEPVSDSTPDDGGTVDDGGDDLPPDLID